MYKKLIPVTGPSITRKEISFIAQAAKDGWNENHLKYVTLFEQKLSAYAGRKYALATSSCTTALHLAYLSLGLQKGDEVIVPDISWVAIIEPLYYIGVKPIFADINPLTWCIDPDKIEKIITSKTKAIVAVNLYGHVADINPITKIAKKYKLKIIEDAAESIGSEYFGRKAGSFGDISVFSFHGSKTLVTGEGGMLLTDDKNIIAKARYYNDHCKSPDKIFWTLDIGYKYKMSNFQAACGLAQLERIDKLVEKKRKIFSWYVKYLSGMSGIQLNFEQPGTKNTYWMVTAIIDKKYKLNKENFLELFNKFNIQVRPIFYPLSQLPWINIQADTPVARDLSPRGINLPSGLMLTNNDVKYICKIFKNILKRKLK